MTVAGRDWFQRNVGYDPIVQPPPDNTFAFIAAKTRHSDEDIQREIIDFDSEDEAGLRFLAFSTATGLSRFTDIPASSGRRWSCSCGCRPDSRCGCPYRG